MKERCTTKVRHLAKNGAGKEGAEGRLERRSRSSTGTPPRGGAKGGRDIVPCEGI